MKMRLVSLCEVVENLRFDASFHNAEINYYNKIIEAHSEYNLNHYCEKIYMSSRGRRCYTTKTFGYPFLSNSDMIAQDPFVNCNYSSRKYGYYEDAILKEGMILTGRVGAIGQTAFVPKFWENLKAMGSDNIIRICVKKEFMNGFIYAYLSSKFGYLSFWKHATGGVQPYITPEMVASLPIPQFPVKFQEKVDSLIKESARLREEACDIHKAATQILYSQTGLNDISIDEYNYFGPPVEKRTVSSFVINKELVTSVTINAFNLSLRNRNLIKRIKRTIETKSLIDCLDENGLFSTGSFPRIELESGHGVMLINQKDIFDTVIKGKYISKRNVKLDKLVEQNEIMIAGVGTLAESESFCRCVYANEYLKGKLVSGEFIRMKTNDSVMPGYLYLWLSSDYGFRLIRSTQAGTKLCRPIPKLLEKIPVPILKRDMMKKINDMELDSQNKLYQSVMKEIDAISLVEKEIDGWKA